MGQMGPEHYCLKWNNHHSNMFDAFGDLLHNESLCDVTLACDGSSIKAHKLVLSASSPFFQDLLTQNTSAHPIVILTDLKCMDMKALIEFMYHGQVSVPESRLMTVLKAAKNLKIKGLGDCPEQSIHFDTGQTSSQGKTFHLKNFSNSVSKDSIKCDENGTRVQTVSYDEARVDMKRNETDYPCDNMEIEKGCSTSEDFQGELPGNADSQLEIIPFKLMEQSMTTEGILEEKEYLENSIEVSDLTKTCDDDNELVENSQLSESQRSDICFSQDLQCKNAVRLQIDDHLSIRSCQTSSNPELVAINNESSNSEHGFSSFMPESLSEELGEISQEHGISNYSVRYPGESSKRGRKPGSRLCVICKHVFNCESDLEKHMYNHRSKSECSDGADLKHLESMETSDSQALTEKNLLKLPLSCCTCKYVMNTLSDAQSHLSTNPDCRTSQFKCFLCPKIFIWPATLIKHFHEQHQGPDGITRVTQRIWFFCDVCKKPLLSKHALSLHRSKFHGLFPHSITPGSPDCMDNSKRGRKRGSRVCRLCKRTFVGSVDFISHLQICPKSTNVLNTVPDTHLNLNESLSSLDNESNFTQTGI